MSDLDIYENYEKTTNIANFMMKELMLNHNEHEFNGK